MTDTPHKTLQKQNSFQSLLLAANTGASLYSAVQLHKLASNSGQATEEIRERLSDLNNGVANLGALFRASLSLQALKAQIDSAQNQQMLDELTAIRATLETPEATRASELENRALTLIQKNLLSEAYELLCRADESYPEGFHTKFYLGHLNLYGLTDTDNLLDYEKALEQFTKAVRIGEAELKSGADIRSKVADAHYHAGMAAFLQATEGLASEQPNSRNALLQRSSKSFLAASECHEGSKDRGSAEDDASSIQAAAFAEDGGVGQGNDTTGAINGPAYFMAAKSAILQNDDERAAELLRHAVEVDYQFIYQTLGLDEFVRLHPLIDRWKKELDSTLDKAQRNESQLEQTIETARSFLKTIRRRMWNVQDELQHSASLHSTRATKIIEELETLLTSEEEGVVGCIVNYSHETALKSGKPQREAIARASQAGVIDLALCVERSISGITTEKYHHPFFRMRSDGRSTEDVAKQVALEVRNGTYDTFFSTLVFDKVANMDSSILSSTALDRLTFFLDLDTFDRDNHKTRFCGSTEREKERITEVFKCNIVRIAWESIERTFGEAYLQASGAGRYPLTDDSPEQGMHKPVISWVTDQESRCVNALDAMQNNPLRRTKRALQERIDQIRRLHGDIQVALEQEIQPVSEKLESAVQPGSVMIREHVDQVVSERFRHMDEDQFRNTLRQIQSGRTEQHRASGISSRFSWGSGVIAVFIIAVIGGGIAVVAPPREPPEADILRAADTVVSDDGVTYQRQRGKVLASGMSNGEWWHIVRLEYSVEVQDRNLVERCTYLGFLSDRKQVIWSDAYITPCDQVDTERAVFLDRLREKVANWAVQAASDM